MIRYLMPRRIGNMICEHRGDTVDEQGQRRHATHDSAFDTIIHIQADKKTLTLQLDNLTEIQWLAIELGQQIVAAT